MSNYPAGAESDPRAPYNQPPVPECRGCGEKIGHGDDHERGCPNEGMCAGELLQQREDDAKIEQAERRMEEQRIQSQIESGVDSE
ncbi:hypothetical protein [Haloarcula sp. Atlit-7R]|uniref:hypothetical protein n=1 Tax=Haloarcula sp. Atlit-7R TaxID=2282125 RepID=UPI0011C4681B|nr:hypothetical protein [Haloarcula sp. Atlit-7R]